MAWSAVSSIATASAASRHGRRPACRRPSWVSRRSSRICWSSPAFARRDRATKTRLYPSLGFFLLLPVAQLFSRATYSLTAGAFVSVVILGMLPSVILEALRTSSNHAATELFAAVPLGSAAPLFQGTRKAAIYYVILPGAVIALLWIAATDAEKLPVAVPSLPALPFLSLLPAAARDYVPFSEPPTAGRQSTANIVVGMSITLVGAAMLAAAWAAERAGHLSHLIALEAIGMFVACRLLGAHLRRRPLRREGGA